MFRVWEKQVVQVFKFYLYVRQKFVKHDLLLRAHIQGKLLIVLETGSTQFYYAISWRSVFYTPQKTENLWLSDFFRGV